MFSLSLVPNSHKKACDIGGKCVQGFCSCTVSGLGDVSKIIVLKHDVVEKQVDRAFINKRDMLIGEGITQSKSEGVGGVGTHFFVACQEVLGISKRE